MPEDESKFVPSEAIEQVKTPETVEQTQMDLGLTPEDEVKEILSNKPYKRVSQEALSLLVPHRIYEVAKNPAKIEIRPLHIEQGEISILVLEKDYVELLTDDQAWRQWESDIEVALKAQEGKRFKVTPQAPESINRLHAKFRTEIDKGELSLSDRILMISKLRIHPSNSQALYVGDFDGESHQGIGQDFYKNILPALANDLGLRFIIGQNHAGNISFFKKTLGRYTMDEIKPEFQSTLLSDNIARDDKFSTIQFLYVEDIEKYVSKDKIRPYENRT